MAVGTLRRIVIDVNDLEVGERFWAAVTGLPLRFSAWQGQFSGLGDIETGSILLRSSFRRRKRGSRTGHIPT